jgi:hypothetical protein
MTTAAPFSIRSLIGKRAVITPTRVELVTPIESGASATQSMFDLMRLTYPDRPCALVFDGWVRAEYGRPMDCAEIEESLASSGLL